MNVTREICQVCGKNADFVIEDNAVLLREAKCSNCGASLRSSDVAGEIIRNISGKKLGLVNQLEELGKYKILNTCSSGYIHNALKNLDNYTCSEFFDDIESGDYYEGVLCVDLCNIPFTDNTFDIIITEDIFEHIIGYEKAMAEILRVLKPHGCHIFTVPLHDGRKTVSRHGKRDVYHGDPIRSDEGCLVVTDWGDDIKDIVENFGYRVEIVRKHNFYGPSEVTVVDESYEEYLAKTDHLNDYLKYNSTVIIAYKNWSAYKEFPKKETVSLEQLKSLYQKSKNTIISLNRSIRNKNDMIKDLNDENENRGKLINKLDAQIEKSGEMIRSLQEGEEKRNIHIKGLDNEIKLREETIQKLQLENKKRNEHIQKLDSEIEKNGKIIRELQQENSDRNSHIAHLDILIEQNNNMITQQKNINESQLSQIVKQSELIAQQNERIIVQSEKIGRIIEQNIKQVEQIEQLSQTIIQQNQEIHHQTVKEQEYEQKIAELLESADIQKQEYEHRMAEVCLPDEARKLEYEQKLTDMRRFTSIRELEIEELHQLLDERELEIQKQQQKLEELYKISETQQSEYEQKTADMQQSIRNKEGHIELLLEVERAYEREKNTHAYHICKRMQKFGNSILPPDSRRRFFLRIVFNIFRHPLLMLHVINPQRIKNYIKYMRLEGMEGVKRRYEEAVSIERMRGGLSEQLDLDLEQIYSSAEGDKQQIDDFERLIFPIVYNPKVSIIIPVYNEFHYTYGCLKSILKNSKGISYEIIIADDCSTDLTRNIKQIVENINVVTSNKNLRFLLNCNNAAKYAEGEYILFLNNDTQVQYNWLEPLVNLIESNDKIGMVGSKLLYPDGKLQEAGGILWKDGSAWNYGNSRNPEDPEFNYVKEVDYISGAAIMIRRSLWNEIGGFDERFAPAYCEDSDLAFEVRKRGYKVMYQPLSVVVHFEGISNGTDTDSGLKAYQVVNQQKFMDKWKSVLESEHYPNAENVFVARDRNWGKKVLLMVDHYVPQYDKDAGSRTVFQYLRMFVNKGFNVKFIGDNFYRHEPYTTVLQQLGIEVLYGSYYANNWKEWIKENREFITQVFLNRPHIAINYIDFIKENTNAKIIYYGHDLHFLREMRKYELTKDKKVLIDSKDWKEKELYLMKKADVVYYPSNVEIDEIAKIDASIGAKAIIAYIFNQEISERYRFDKRKDIMFVGGFTHTPNVDAVLWFAKEIFPKVVKALPDIKLYVLGSNPPLEIQNLDSSSIIVKGFVPDDELEQFYRSCRISIVPLRYGAGIKGKVIEAMRYGIPVETTSVGAEGILEIEKILCIEDDAEKFADELINLYNNRFRLEKMSKESCKYIRNNFSEENAWKIIEEDFI